MLTGETAARVRFERSCSPQSLAERGIGTPMPQLLTKAEAEVILREQNVFMLFVYHRQYEWFMARNWADLRDDEQRALIHAQQQVEFVISMAVSYGIDGQRNV